MTMLDKTKLQQLERYLNPEWASILTDFAAKATVVDNCYEAVGFSYRFSPVMSMAMSLNSSLFTLEKAAAMYYWYKKANPYDRSIIKYFSEYERCIDSSHPRFNSNYGVYAYQCYGLKRCAEVLLKNKSSRHATLCINNNRAMGPGSIDKLCTNTLQFFIRDNSLQLIVQMRSSNFVTLLPYDSFMFSVFYFNVFSLLRKTYTDLSTGHITMQVASLHTYSENIDSIICTEPIEAIRVNYNDNNWQLELEKKLLMALQN